MSAGDRPPPVPRPPTPGRSSRRSDAPFRGAPPPPRAPRCRDRQKTEPRLMKFQLPTPDSQLRPITHNHQPISGVTLQAMYSVTKRIDFCYGHRLLDYDGVCRHPHGHNAVVEIDVASDTLDSRNMVIDFGDIKRVVRSEERRVGKECSRLRAPSHCKSN